MHYKIPDTKIIPKRSRMCLKIVTHKMVCDVRPVMSHPSRPGALIVDPFTIGQGICCNANANPSEILRCPTHKCCQVTVRSFPCGCSNTVGYHRYKPAKAPSAYTIEEREIPDPGVWRTLQTLDDVFEPPNQTQSTPSEELQIARRGMNFIGAQLGPVAKGLTAAAIAKNLKEQNLKNGAPYEKQVEAAHTALEHIESEARDLLASYNTWKHMKEKFEQAEYGKVFAIEMLA
ncbi:hypothetical protein F5Y19DRAFT_237394 [Xylariaceae sp. FL1651]|nr:hypothetical protein F5Y19DRAFT_237394 [Xylariaceae sp. FL1651]